MRLVLAALTLAACSTQVAPQDGGVDGAVCVFPATGRTCDPVVGCPDEIACNWCGCSLLGTPTAQPVCNQVACLADGGAKVAARCASTSECQPNERCVYDPGCPGTMGRCTAAELCKNSLGIGGTGTGLAKTRICDCAGNTITASTVCGVEQPYRAIGACP